MSARKPHSRWDLVWVLDRTIEHGIPVRFVPRLGRKRPLLERMTTRRGKNYAWVPITAALFALLVVGGKLAESGDRGHLTLVNVSGAALFVAAVWIGLYFLRDRDDVRFVVAARVRTRVMRKKDRREVATAIAERRQRWKDWLDKSHPAANGAHLLRSRALRIWIAVYSVVGMIGVMRDKHPGAFKSMWISSEYWGGGSLILMASAALSAYWIWGSIKRRLTNSLNAGACPDCGYVSGIGENATTATGMKVDFGPERCSECGCPWPLVPPPTKREMRR